MVTSSALSVVGTTLKELAKTTTTQFSFCLLPFVFLPNLIFRSLAVSGRRWLSFAFNSGDFKHLQAFIMMHKLFTFLSFVAFASQGENTPQRRYFTDTDAPNSFRFGYHAGTSCRDHPCLADTSDSSRTIHCALCFFM